MRPERRHKGEYADGSGATCSRLSFSGTANCGSPEKRQIPRVWGPGPQLNISSFREAAERNGMAIRKPNQTGIEERERAQSRCPHVAPALQALCQEGGRLQRRLGGPTMLQVSELSARSHAV